MATTFSDDLEAELGTDPQSFDTDGDGLYDYYEVLGRDGQSIRDLGADPLHRDIFIELDQHAGMFTYQPETPEHDIATMQEVYNDLPRLPLNPDGQPGISIDVDTGATCTNATLCGDWGGHSLISDSDPSGADHTTYGYIVQNQTMIPARQGLFHYGWRADPDAGSATQYSPGTSFWFAGQDSYSNTEYRSIEHELGHGLGLQHWGIQPADGEVGENYKFNYPSLMNYDFQNHPVPGYGHPRFSEGRLASLSYLNLDELSWSPGVDLSDITSAVADDGYTPTWAPTVCPSAAQCSAAPDPAHALDFNGDGRWTSGGVRFDYSPINIKATGRWPVAYGAKSMNGTPDGGPGLAAVGSTLYAFAVFGGQMYVGVKGGGLFGWAWTRLGLAWTPSRTGETAASWFPESGGDNVLIVHPQASTNRLYYAVYNTSTGSVVQQGAIPRWPWGATARQATVMDGTVVFRDNHHDASGDPTDEIWTATLSPSLSWSSWSQVSDASGPILSTMTPGLAAASDLNTYLVTQRGGFIHFYLRPTGTTGIFTENTDFQVRYSDPKDQEDSRTRLNLLFLHYLKADGSQFSDGSGYLAVFFNYRDPNNSRDG